MSLPLAEEPAPGFAPELSVEAVHPDYLEAAWPLVEPHIERAVKGSVGGEYRITDVLTEIVTGEAILWAVYETETKDVVAAATTKVVQYKSGIRAVQFIMVGGDNAARWFGHLADAVEAWARELGVQRVEAIGRRGWIRKFLNPLGYRETYMHFSKDLSDG